MKLFVYLDDNEKYIMMAENREQALDVLEKLVLKFNRNEYSDFTAFIQKRRESTDMFENIFSIKVMSRSPVQQCINKEKKCTNFREFLDIYLLEIEENNVVYLKNKDLVDSWTEDDINEEDSI